MVRRFISSFNALCSRRSGRPTRITGSLHADNAGEFISRDFQDMLDDELVDHTTSPPHIHALNGVAERAIRSSMELARSYLTSSRVPVEHWPHTVLMAVDVLNRTSGTTADGDGPTSHELLIANQSFSISCRSAAAPLLL